MMPSNKESDKENLTDEELLEKEVRLKKLRLEDKLIQKQINKEEQKERNKNDMKILLFVVVVGFVVITFFMAYG